MPQVKCKFKKLGKFISDIESLKNNPEMLAASREYEIAKSHFDTADYA